MCKKTSSFDAASLLSASIGVEEVEEAEEVEDDEDDEEDDEDEDEDEEEEYEEEEEDEDEEEITILTKLMVDEAAEVHPLLDFEPSQNTLYESIKLD
jgi:TATA-binding protein-associated factor Taf7